MLTLGSLVGDLVGEIGGAVGDEIGAIGATPVGAFVGGLLS